MNYEIIELDGKKFPIFFGFNGLRKYCRNTGTSLNKLMTLGQDITLDEALNLVLVGIDEGCRKSGEKFTLTIDDLGDMLDNDMEGLSRALEIFGEQMGQNVKQASDKGKKGGNVPKK
jgi:hypothetical protein|tara:strand:- start:7848 stop:8198 length:351 start_codon:yes stop_codon:yes gene_type:complete